MIKKIFELIRPEQVFPLILILLDIAAGVVRFLRRRSVRFCQIVEINKMGVGV